VEVKGLGVVPERSQLRQRLLSAAVFIPILLVIIWFGPLWLFSLLIAAVALLGAIEFYRLATHGGWQPSVVLGVAFTLFFIADAYFAEPRATEILIPAAVALPLLWLLLRSRGEKTLANWLWTVGGIFYIGWMLGHFIPLRELEQGRDWVILALFTTFAADSGGYLFGRAWGRHLMVPKISPGKTWEGTFAGIIAGIAAAVALNAILGLPVSYWQVSILGFLIAAVAFAGDLVESMLKRSTGVKDSGRLIPGHGGILDRLDSVVFTVVLVYYYVVWVIM
jgi:phosphatidate cytidylyltransferase